MPSTKTAQPLPPCPYCNSKFTIKKGRRLNRFRILQMFKCRECLHKFTLDTFRHTFRTLLDETGAPMKVQQELMRHSDIRTTMNVYGKAMDESKRKAHGKVVRLVLPSKVA